MNFTTNIKSTLRILFCCSISREMLRGRSSLSTIPFTKPRYSGMSSSQLSMINTRRTYSLMLFCFFLVSNKSKGARLQQGRSVRHHTGHHEEKTMLTLLCIVSAHMTSYDHMHAMSSGCLTSQHNLAAHNFANSNRMASMTANSTISVLTSNKCSGHNQ